MGYSPWSCKDSDMPECAYTVTQSWSIYSQMKNTPRRVWDHAPKSSFLIFFCSKSTDMIIKKEREKL